MIVLQEKFTTIELRAEKEKKLPKIIIKDSFNFLAASLDKLVDNLKALGEKRYGCAGKAFPHLKSYFNERWRHIDKSKFNLLLRKGVFPYEWADNFEKFDETNLPPQDAFYNKLREQRISDEDYLHAKNVWSSFQIENFGQYQDLYLECDVLLLTDVMETFRKTTLIDFKLDPMNYATLPGLSWDAGLQYSKVELEIVKDYDMNLFIDRQVKK